MIRVNLLGIKKCAEPDFYIARFDINGVEVSETIQLVKDGDIETLEWGAALDDVFDKDIGVGRNFLIAVFRFIRGKTLELPCQLNE